MDKEKDPTERVNDQLKELQNSVKKNIKMQRERGASLKGLEKRTDKLQEDAGLFKKKSAKVKQKYFLKYAKWVLIAVVIGLILISMIFGIKKK